MDRKNNVTTIGSFIEVYREYMNHGEGIMLCYISPSRKLEYVMFRQETGYKKFIFNDKLLDLYNSLP